VQYNVHYALRLGTTIFGAYRMLVQPLSAMIRTVSHRAQVESMIRLILYSRYLSSNLLVSAEFAVEARLSRSKELDENNAGNDNNATQQKLHNQAQAILRRTTNQRHRLLDLRRKLLVHSRLLGSLRAHNFPFVVQRHSRPSFAFQA
jgi:hypothetical protein